jgi:hypothetical protein
LVVGQTFSFNNREHDNPHIGGPEILKNPVTKEQKVPGVFDIYLAHQEKVMHVDGRAAATVSSAVISNSLVPKVVGMARAAQRSAGIAGGVTCQVPRMEEEPQNVAAPGVSSAFVMSPASVSWRRRAMVSVPARVVTKARGGCVTVVAAST